MAQEAGGNQDATLLQQTCEHKSLSPTREANANTCILQSFSLQSDLLCYQGVVLEASVALKGEEREGETTGSGC